jgi:peroxiredoxin
MNKKGNIILWIATICLMFIAAHTVYTKYKPNIGAQQPAVNKSQALKDAKEKQKVLVADFKLKDISGKEVKLSDYRGKIVILNFWATWCRYCKQEMPDLNELNKQLEKGKDAVIIAVDVQEDLNTVKSFLNANNISLNVLLDEDGAVTQTYGVTGFPTTLVIDRDGAAVKYIPGVTDKETLLNIISKINKK